MNRKRTNDEGKSDLPAQEPEDTKKLSSGSDETPQKKSHFSKVILTSIVTILAVTTAVAYYRHLVKQNTYSDNITTSESITIELPSETNTTDQQNIPIIQESEITLTNDINNYTEPLPLTVEEEIQIASPKSAIQHQQSSVNPEAILTIIELREAFKTAGKCRPLLEKLIKLPFTPSTKNTITQLLPICLERPLNEQMKEAFYKVKTKAIFRIFQQEYPLYMAYLKILPYYLADIHKTNPTGNSPMDTLDKIQKAINEDHPIQVIALIDTLPANAQGTLHEVYRHATAEKNLYTTLTQLTKELLTQGADND